MLHAGCLILDSYEGEIPARSKRTIRGVVKPLLRCSYSFQIMYQLVTPDGNEKTSEEKDLLTVRWIFQQTISNRIGVSSI